MIVLKFSWFHPLSVDFCGGYSSPTLRKSGTGSLAWSLVTGRRPTRFSEGSVPWSVITGRRPGRYGAAGHHSDLLKVAEGDSSSRGASNGRGNSSRGGSNRRRNRWRSSCWRISSERKINWDNPRGPRGRTSARCRWRGGLGGGGGTWSTEHQITKPEISRAESFPESPIPQPPDATGTEEHANPGLPRG